MAKVQQHKDKDFDAIDPRIDFNDMIDEQKKETIEFCRGAYSKF